MRWIALIFFGLSFGQVEAASFNCTNAQSFSETAVCSDPELSRLDDTLAEAYKAALKAVPDQKVLQYEQKHWLQIRDSCTTASCLREAYERRLKSLKDVAAFTKKGADRYLCTGAGASFEIKDGVITRFYSQTAVEGEEFALGYTLTCVQHIDKFIQVKNENMYVLQFSEDNDQYGETRDCRVLIQDLGSLYRVRSSRCSSECMQFDFKINKNACAKL